MATIGRNKAVADLTIFRFGGFAWRCICDSLQLCDKEGNGTPRAQEAIVKALPTRRFCYFLSTAMIRLTLETLPK
jgi:hypothetical protein